MVSDGKVVVILAQQISGQFFFVEIRFRLF